jgi:hypothetical protein
MNNMDRAKGEKGRKAAQVYNEQKKAEYQARLDKVEAMGRGKRWIAYSHHFPEAESLCFSGKCSCRQDVLEKIFPKLDEQLLERIEELAKDTNPPKGYRFFSYCEINQIVNLYSIGCTTEEVQRLVGLPDSMISDDCIRNQYKGLRKDLFRHLRQYGQMILHYSVRKKLIDLAINSNNTQCLLFLAKAELGMSDNPNVNSTVITHTLDTRKIEKALEKHGVKIIREQNQPLLESSVDMQSSADVIDVQYSGQEDNGTDIANASRANNSGIDYANASSVPSDMAQDMHKQEPCQAPWPIPHGGDEKDG